MNWQDLHLFKFTLLDFLDILVVAIIIYGVLNLLKGTIAVNIIIGVGIISLFYWMVKSLHMQLLTGILDKFLSVGVIALIIIFQQEIRRFLLILGKNFTNNRSKFWIKLFNPAENEQQINYDKIKPVVEACQFMKSTKTGALIVFTKHFDDAVFTNRGEVLNAVISKSLIETIFSKNSPLHDGAVVICDDQIKVASCILPLTDSLELPLHYGLRHRAGIGVTEQTDSLALIVSEETGEISFAKEGKLNSDVSITELERMLYSELFQ